MAFLVGSTVYPDVVAAQVRQVTSIEFYAFKLAVHLVQLAIKSEHLKQEVVLFSGKKKFPAYYAQVGERIHLFCFKYEPDLQLVHSFKDVHWLQYLSLASHGVHLFYESRN